MTRRKGSIVLLLLIVSWRWCDSAMAQSSRGTDPLDRPMIISARSAYPERVSVVLRSVDISRFPEVSVILDARDSSGAYFGDLKKNDLFILQDNRPVTITALEQISSSNTLPIDIVFVIDQTGSMRPKVNEVKNNIAEFAQRLAHKGVDYRLGLISFSDRIERRREFAEDVNTFISWIDGLTIGGGGDDNENALEGLYEATTLRFRQSAQKILILITDAMYHQKGDKGDGRTEFTTESMVTLLEKQAVRLFAITPPQFESYERLTEVTRGKRFNIIESFSSLLDDFTASLTNLYAVRYRMSETVPPEKVILEIRNSRDEVVLNEDVPVLEVDKKFVLENILFDFNQATFNRAYVEELQSIYEMLKQYPAMHVEVRGHTDMIGSDEYNIALSDARARSIKKYLTDRGISSHRITTRGMGKSQPIASNDTELGRRLNRRTEIIITQK